MFNNVNRFIISSTDGVTTLLNAVDATVNGTRVCDIVEVCVNVKRVRYREKSRYRSAGCDNVDGHDIMEKVAIS